MYLFELWFPLDICPVAVLLGYMVGLFLVFKGISILFSIVAVPVYISTNTVGGGSIDWEIGIDIYTLLYVFKIENQQGPTV